MRITIIAAIDKQGAIGYENKLLFYLPADLKHFKSLTTGHTILMGRKTFESLPKGALPERRNIVLSSKGTEFKDAETFTSVELALQHCKNDEEIFILGGDSLYKQTVSIADSLCITHIDATAENADAFFPEIDSKIWKETSHEKHEPDEKNKIAFCFTTYERREK